LQVRLASVNPSASYAFFGRISRPVGSVSSTDSCQPVMSERLAVVVGLEEPPAHAF
jgi:hypothetical protein